MILAGIADLSRYVDVNPNFKVAFDFLKNTDLSSLEIGKIELDGTNVFVKVMNSKLVAAEDAKLEVHNNYLDIQVPVGGAETYGWIKRSDMKAPKADFDTVKDVQFYADKPTTYVKALPGEVAIFFPEDGHAPQIGEGEILKVVVKVAI